MKYFAYGSNMNPDRMNTREVHFKNMNGAILKGYRLEFNKVAKANPAKGFATIIFDPDEIVEGILYEIEDEDIKKLDIFEGYPNHYDRKEITVNVNGLDVKAIVYIAQQDWIKTGLKPTQEYLNHLLSAKEDISESYYNKLKNVVVLNP